jgi:proline iminopeptidase
MKPFFLSRRALIGGAIALSAATRLPAAPKRGKLMPVRDTRLHVEVSGPKNAPVLVYLHGGPGVGSYEFSHYASDLLAKNWRLVVFDQRGVLQSDPLAADAKYGMDDLVADTDALRAALGIERWSLLGHSFGGHYALRYALAHPERVETLFLENPAYSFPESTRSNLRATAALFTKLGKPEDAAKVKALVDADLTPRALLDATLKGMGDLGEERQSLYLYDQKNRGFFGRLEKASGLPGARWTQGQTQAMKLFEDGKLLEPMIDRLSGWTGPTVLIKGENDNATSPEEMAAVAALPKGRVVHVAKAGHFIHVEQPGELAKIVVPA